MPSQGHEEKQKFLKALRNRQDLFQEEGILNLILDCIDKMNVVSEMGLVSALAGEEAGEQWNDVSGYLFEILGMFLQSIILILWSSNDLTSRMTLHPVTLTNNQIHSVQSKIYLNSEKTLPPGIELIK